MPRSGKTKAEAQHEMGHEGTRQGRSSGLPLAHQEVRGPGGRIPVRSQGAGHGRCPAGRRDSVRRPGSRVGPPRGRVLVRGDRPGLRSRKGSGHRSPGEDRQRRRHRQHPVESTRGCRPPRDRRGVRAPRLQGRPRDQRGGMDRLRRALRLLQGGDEMTTHVLALLLAAAGAAPAASPGAPSDAAKIEELTGAKGSFDAKEGAFKVSVPRGDLSVTAAGVKLTPPMGLTSWAAFKKAGGHTVVMGDTVLLEDQVNPVMSVALDNGLEVTALHNHFFWDTPKVMFMHIGGMGDEAALASAVGKVFAKIKDTSGGKGEVPHADIDPARSTLDPKKIDAILGKTGDFKNGVYKATFGRETKMHGEAMGNTMGVNTWAAFAGSDDNAVVDGDFAMLEPELQGVLKALRGAGINIVAIHQHMSGESPRVLFLHYWGIGSTTSLATGLKRALDGQSK